MKKLITEKNKAFLLLQSEKVNNNELLKVRVKDVFSGYKDKDKHDLLFQREIKVIFNGEEKRISRVSVPTELANEFKKFKSEQIKLERIKIIKANPQFAKNVEAFLNSSLHHSYLAEMEHFCKENNEQKHRVPFKKNEELKEEMIFKNIDRSPSLTYTPCGSIKEKIIEILIEDYFASKGMTGKYAWELNANIVDDKNKLINFKIVEVHEKISPSGGENGVDGYIDATISNGNKETRVVYRDVFDFGAYGYPKRLDGKEALNRELYTKDEIEAIDFLSRSEVTNEFSLRM